MAKSKTNNGTLLVRIARLKAEVKSQNKGRQYETKRECNIRIFSTMLFIMIRHHGNIELKKTKPFFVFAHLVVHFILRFSTTTIRYNNILVCAKAMQFLFQVLWIQHGQGCSLAGNPGNGCAGRKTMLNRRRQCRGLLGRESS